MNMSADPKIATTTIELLDSYLFGEVFPECLVVHGERMEPECFLQKIFDERKYDDDVRDKIAELFFRVLKYEKLLDMVLKKYYESRTRRFPRQPDDYALYMVLLYFAIFELNEVKLLDIKDVMMAVNVNKAFALAGFLKKPNFVSLLFASAVQIWDVDYVRQNLLSSVQESVFAELHKGIQERIASEQKSKQKELTKPVEMQVLKRSEKAKLIEERNTISSETQSLSEVSVKIKPTPIPKTTYIEPDYPKKLEEDRMRNQEKAKELYEEAQKKAFRVAALPKSKVNLGLEKCERKVVQIRRSKIPVKKEPAIQPKKTAAVILREGARLLKMEQEEIKRLEDISRGAFNSEALKALEREIQEERMRKEVEEIEKKHIQGLLTYEEALIAKQKYLKKMKEGADEFRKEKEIWMKHLESWKAEEQIRIRESVEKGKAFEKGVKEAVEHVKEEKHRLALETMEESRSLKEKWLAEKEEELKRKIQMIKEIKALQAFGVIRRREAAENASASIGLLCEMSTEELKERLMILRLEVKEEMERRREEIKQKKECRKAIVDGYRGLIEQHQELRKEKQRAEQIEKKRIFPVRSSSVEALQKKLQEKRKERLKHLTITQRA